MNVNGRDPTVNAEPEMPLLWVLRDELGIVGPKYGCGITQCGACTVHIDGVTVRSCSLRVGDVQGSVATIDGLGRPDALHAVQKARIEHPVAKCGYCQSGHIMAAAAFLAVQPAPTDEQIDSAMSASLCRCCTYPRNRLAEKTAAANLRAD